MNELLDRRVLFPLATIFLMQSVIAMGAYAIPVVMPDAAAEIGIKPEWVGYLTAIVYGGATLVGVQTGRLIRAVGATGVFRLLMIFTALGTLLLTVVSPLFAFLGALVIGLANGPMNPCGSHVLSRVAPPGWRAFVFSVKQCGTPMGGLLAGLVLSPLIVLWGWREALWVIPVLASLLFLVAGFGGLGNKTMEKQAPSEGSRAAGGMRDSLRLVFTSRQISATAFGGLLMAGSQVSLAAYLVVYLWREAGMSPVAAGMAFGAMHFTSIVVRILLGLIADRRIAADLLLVILCLVTGIGVAVMGGFTAEWPRPAIYAVIVVIGASSNGWVGLFFAELARLAPPGRAAEVAGGGQVLMYGGVFLTPILCAALLEATGRYGAVFTLLAGAAFVAAGVLTWGRRGG